MLSSRGLRLSSLPHARTRGDGAPALRPQGAWAEAREAVRRDDAAVMVEVDLTHHVEQLVDEAQREFGPGTAFEVRLPLPTGFSRYRPSLVLVSTLTNERSGLLLPYFDMSTGSIILAHGRTLDERPRQ